MQLNWKTWKTGNDLLFSCSAVLTSPIKHKFRDEIKKLKMSTAELLNKLRALNIYIGHTMKPALVWYVFVLSSNRA